MSFIVISGLLAKIISNEIHYETTGLNPNSNVVFSHIVQIMLVHLSTL